MKVALHADAAGHKIPGGIGVYASQLLYQLHTSHPEHSYEFLLSRDGERSDWMEGRVLRNTLPLRFLYPSWNFLRRPRLSGGFDVIHATAFVMPPGDAALVATIHDLSVELFPHFVPEPWRTIYKKGLKIALREAAAIIAISRAVKQQIIEAHQIDPGRIHVTHLAANVTPQLRDLQPHSPPPWPYILNVGTLDPRKNQAGLVRAFSLVADELKDHRLILAGARGWGAKEVIAAIESSGVGDRVIIKDGLDRTAIASLYDSADAVVQPSLYEGFGIPLVEAFSFGKPTISSLDPASKEVAGDAAVLVDCDGDDELAEALVRVVTDGQLREELSARARLRSKDFSWSSAADETVAVYESTAD